MKALIKKYRKEVEDIKVLIKLCKTKSAKYQLAADAATYLKVIKDLESLQVSFPISLFNFKPFKDAVKHAEKNKDASLALILGKLAGEVKKSQEKVDPLRSHDLPMVFMDDDTKKAWNCIDCDHFQSLRDLNSDDSMARDKGSCRNPNRKESRKVGDGDYCTEFKDTALANVKKFIQYPEHAIDEDGQLIEVNEIDNLVSSIKGAFSNLPNGYKWQFQMANTKPDDHIIVQKTGDEKYIIVSSVGFTMVFINKLNEQLNKTKKGEKL